MAKKNIATVELTPVRTEGVQPKRHTKAKSVAMAASSQLPLEEEIQLVAYLHSEKRGFQGGSPEEDWLRAEQEVRQRRQS